MSDNLPEGFPNFTEVAEKYWSEHSKDADTKTETKPNSVAVVTPPSTEALMDAFTTAFDTVVVQPVQWPDDLPVNHPIRNLPVHVKLWTGPQWHRFWLLNKQVETNGVVDEDATRHQLELQFWYVILISTCTTDNQMIFASMLKDSDDNYDEEACLAMKAKYGGPAGLLTMNPLYIAAMGFNGLLKVNEERDAKNSDTANTSTSSGE
jgi:hypothetical protein